MCCDGSGDTDNVDKSLRLYSCNFYLFYQLINEEIGPKLAKLKTERNQYLELQKISREIEHLSKNVIAWVYTNEEVRHLFCLLYILIKFY